MQSYVWPRSSGSLSPGGVESLLEHRATVEAPDSPVPDNLLRISVGIEDVGDLVADLEWALTQA